MDVGDWLLLIQGSLYVFTGIWPVVSRRTFEAVTGPKTDWWLVKTVGLIVTVTGLVLLSAIPREGIPREVALLGMGNALALLYIDLRYVAKKRIRPIYLTDAASESALLVGWSLLLLAFGVS